MREIAHVLPLERSSGRDRGGVAGRVAVAVLDRRRRDDDVVDGLRERALGRAGDQPRLAREPAHRLERQRGPTFVRDRDEDIGLGRVPRTISSACAARPHARAAWNDVPQPVKRTREPSGSRRSPTRSGTSRSHSGCWAMAFRVSCPGTRRVYTIERRGHLREDDAGQRDSRRDRAVPAGGIGVVLRHARGRLEVRDARVEGHRALRRAHVLQGHGAASDRAHDLDRDRRDRRRVQRLHGQGAHRLLRPLRVGDTRHRARRPRRHAPPLALRRGGDHEGEGRDPRGDERVPRHAAALRRECLRQAPVRGSAARLGHPRDAGDDRGGDARDVHLVPRQVVPPRTHGRRNRRPDRRRAHRATGGAAGWHRGP